MLNNIFIYKYIMEKIHMEEIKNSTITDPFHLQDLDNTYIVGRNYEFRSSRFDNVKYAIEQFVEDADGIVDKTNIHNGFRFMDKYSDVIIEINFYKKNKDVYIIEFHKPYAYHTTFEFNIIVNKLIEKIKIFF